MAIFVSSFAAAAAGAAAFRVGWAMKMILHWAACLFDDWDAIMALCAVCVLFYLFIYICEWEPTDRAAPFHLYSHGYYCVRQLFRASYLWSANCRLAHTNLPNCCFEQ